MDTKDLATLGVPGLVVVILALVGVVVTLFNLLIKEKDKRFQDQKENNALYREAMGQFSQTSKLMLAKLDGREE